MQRERGITNAPIPPQSKEWWGSSPTSPRLRVTQLHPPSDQSRYSARFLECCKQWGAGPAHPLSWPWGQLFQLLHMRDKERPPSSTLAQVTSWQKRSGVTSIPLLMTLEQAHLCLYHQGQLYSSAQVRCMVHSPQCCSWPEGQGQLSSPHDLKTALQSATGGMGLGEISPLSSRLPDIFQTQS